MEQQVSVQITEIKISPKRRKANAAVVKSLSESIAEVGLLSPIVLDTGYALVSGLHRIEAFKLLGKTEITAFVRSFDKLQAELAEIDENFVRSPLDEMERNEILLRRKEIYEALHPETKNGGDRKSEKIRKSRCVSDSEPPKSFTRDTAEKLNLSTSTVDRRVRIARDLTPEAKQVIRGADKKFSQKEELKLTRVPAEHQEAAAKQYAAGGIKTVSEYKPEYKPAPTGKQYSTFQESLADLKNPDKDCSCTPDVFLTEFSLFVKNFQGQLDLFRADDYRTVFPRLTEEQFGFLRKQVDIIRSSAEDYLKFVKES